MTRTCEACGRNKVDEDSKLCLDCFGKWLDYASKLIMENRKKGVKNDAQKAYNKWIKLQQKKRKEQVKFT